jgi:hypothetical protein
VYTGTIVGLAGGVEMGSSWGDVRLDGLEPRWWVEAVEGWGRSGHDEDVLPYFTFPADWRVCMLPPWGGHAVRFHVILPSGQWKSAYLALTYHKSGPEAVDLVGPYDSWEVYPIEGKIKDDETGEAYITTGQCAVNDIDRLMELLASPVPSWKKGLTLAMGDLSFIEGGRGE